MKLGEVKVFDTRLRPPYGGYKDNFIYTADFLQHYSEQFGFPTDPAAKEKSMDILIKEMDQLNIAKAVIPLRNWNASMNNAELLQIMLDYPGRFIGIAGIDPFSESSKQEIDEFVVNGNCSGINIEPGMCGEGYTAMDAKLYPLYERCQNEQIPIVISYGGFCHTWQKLNNPEHIDRVAKDFPKLRLIVIHGGWPRTTEMCAVTMNNPEVYMSPDCYLIRTPGNQDYITAANYFCKDKLMFGSAFPLLPLKDAVEYYLNCGIRDEVLPDIMYNNAIKAFKVK